MKRHLLDVSLCDDGLLSSPDSLTPTRVSDLALAFSQMRLRHNLHDAQVRALQPPVDNGCLAGHHPSL
jgi:hypothetical protein